MENPTRPLAVEIESMRERALECRRLAKAHRDNGNIAIAAKLSEVAADLEDKVSKLDQLAECLLPPLE